MLFNQLNEPPSSVCTWLFCLTSCQYFQCRRKTFMVHQTFVWWALPILYKFVKSPNTHLGLAIENVHRVRRFLPTLYFEAMIFYGIWLIMGGIDKNDATFVWLVGVELAPGNPTLWRGVPVASIQKSFRSSGQDWKPWKKWPIPCKFCTYRFIRYSSTCYGKVLINPLMANIRNPDFLPPRWWMLPGLLWFGHVIWIGIC